MHAKTIDLIQRYYAAFNAGRMAAFLELLDEHVAHDINQGSRETGRIAFAAFMERMNAHYQEQVTELVVLTDATGTRAAAEFVVNGRYLKTDARLPEARGQTYRLPAGAFFRILDDKITRISLYYNLQDWISQVST